MEFKEMKFTERTEIVELFSVWLKPYKHEAICRVMEQADEIINDERTLDLLRELKTREEKEADDERRSIESLLQDFEVFKEYEVHNHPITHSQSYRDILYDMYIRKNA